MMIKKENQHTFRNKENHRETSVPKKLLKRNVSKQVHK